MPLAIKHLQAVAEDPSADPDLKAMNTALLASAEGDWDKAADTLRQIVEDNPENFVVRVLNAKCQYSLAHREDRR